MSLFSKVLSAQSSSSWHPFFFMTAFAGAEVGYADSDQSDECMIQWYSSCVWIQRWVYDPVVYDPVVGYACASWLTPRTTKQAWPKFAPALASAPCLLERRLYPICITIVYYIMSYSIRYYNVAIIILYCKLIYYNTTRLSTYGQFSFRIAKIQIERLKS